MIGISVYDTSSPLARPMMVFLMASILELSSEFSSFALNASLDVLSALRDRIKNVLFESMDG